MNEVQLSTQMLSSKNFQNDCTYNFCFDLFISKQVLKQVLDTFICMFDWQE